MITAKLNNYRQSPRKVRLLANLIKGKPVTTAVALLNFANKRASNPLKRLLLSALANAKVSGANSEGLVVKSIRVDGGVVLKRSMPRARGSAFQIKKRTSHILVVLEERPSEKLKVKSPKEKNKPKETAK